MSTSPDPGTGSIGLHITGALTTAGVQARIDGTKVPLTLPSTLVPVPAGPHEVEVAGLQGFITTFGETRMNVQVHPGQHVDVHYALPRTHLSQGRIGLVPQQRSWGLHWPNIALGCGGAVLLLLVAGVLLTLWRAVTG